MVALRYIKLTVGLMVEQGMSDKGGSGIAREYYHSPSYGRYMASVQ